MRIISGRYRRRKLEPNPGTTTRPISDYVKESLFERLQHHLAGRRVADVFSGTGTLGLEALSRGAESVLFIEQDDKAFELLKKNVAALGVEENTLCWQADVFRCSFRPKNAERFLPCGFVFFDPPYRMIEAIQPGSPLYRSLERIARDDFTSPGAVLAIRTPADVPVCIPEPWHSWPELPRAEFSNMTIHLFEKSGDHGAGIPARLEPPPTADEANAAATIDRAENSAGVTANDEPASGAFVL